MTVPAKWNGVFLGSSVEESDRVLVTHLTCPHFLYQGL
jgi:hypothetical protein